jgi:hypothetical protein
MVPTRSKQASVVRMGGHNILIQLTLLQWNADQETSVATRGFYDTAVTNTKWPALDLRRCEIVRPPDVARSSRVSTNVNPSHDLLS